MEKKLTCFVIIGFGKKTSFATQPSRNLDLDQTFKFLIKPVFDELGIDCYRAIDKNTSGSIDKLMLEEIKNADFALVDISTLNANVMWELGVRHALRPNHTIMICEQKQMSAIPFDVNHYVIHQYVHSEEGIPFVEVDRFRTYLKELIEKILKEDPKKSDSPVFDFLGDSLLPKQDNGPSFNDLLTKAESEKKSGNLENALTFYNQCLDIARSQTTLKDNVAFLICRIALCTYKTKKPDEQSALNKALDILAELNPNESSDVEVLGLSGAIHKRLFELTSNKEHLESAIKFYEKGYELKNDYYNGINAAFMLYVKASTESDPDDSITEAQFYRNKTLKVALDLESNENFSKSPDAIWVLLTIAEAYHYKNDTAKMEDYEKKAQALADKNNDTFAMGSYFEQKEKIKKLNIKQ